jgi:hypothetical protein
MPDEQRDFFISFNSADEAYAKAISDALRAEGFTTFFHPDDLEFGGYIPKWMNDALLNARQMLALCSPEYMNEGAVFSEAERYARFWQDTRGKEFKLIPVVLKDTEFPPLLAPYKRLTATGKTPVEAAAAVVAALKRPEVIKERKALQETRPSEAVRQPAYVHTTRLPETGYERLVGRDAELESIDKAWLNAKINILSLVAEGGAGKSALVNEWIKRMQAHSYPGAEAVLGWSFFSQGTESATSAEEFLSWALEKLHITLLSASASNKADAIAEAMMRRRVLLVLDGVEPLQHGPGTRLGQLKDKGLRALLRRFAAAPPGADHGLILLTSRLAVNDIASWRDGAAPVVDVERLSDEAGSLLLRDNGVEGAEAELKAAARDFGGHPLALGLLASFIKETQAGDVRRRDHIRAYLADRDNPRHDHARRVMESYEREWLAERPMLRSIMHVVGLFDRPASGDCVDALRAEPAIHALTNEIIKLDNGEWQRAVGRLREVRLLAPLDPAAPDALDAHPLVREWFGERLRQTNQMAWTAAHGRIFEHLQKTTKEGDKPTLGDLAPLYQAIAHACCAGLHQKAINEVYIKRICRRKEGGELEFYSIDKLGAFDNDLAVLSLFFEKPYEVLIAALPKTLQNWISSMAGGLLVTQGRLAEALPAQLASLRANVAAKNWVGATTDSINLFRAEFTSGKVASALVTAEQSVSYADLSDRESLKIIVLAIKADALAALGRRQEAELDFANAERRQKEWNSRVPFLCSFQGYHYCNFLLADGDYAAVVDRADRMLQVAESQGVLQDIAISKLVLGRAHLGLALEGLSDGRSAPAEKLRLARNYLDEAIENMRGTGAVDNIPICLLARSALYRNVGDWNGALRDLDDVEEIAGRGPMLLFLCDVELQRARLSFAKIEAFAPLNALLDESRPRPTRPSDEEIGRLRSEAGKQLDAAAGYIETCSYHLRDEELTELQGVLYGEHTLASLPPRV